MIVCRLNKLIEVELYVQALNYSQKAVHSIRHSAADQLLRRNVSVPRQQYLIATCISLLAKFGKNAQIMNEIRAMDGEEINDFLIAFSGHGLAVPLGDDGSRNEGSTQAGPMLVQMQKWHDIAIELASQSYIEQLLNIDPFLDVHGDRLEYFLGLWLEENESDPAYHAKFAQIMKYCHSCKQTYKACDILYKKVHFLINFNY